MPIDPYVVHRDDMGMIEPCHRLRLEQEPPTDLVGALGQDLDGDFAFEHVVDATKDLGHTAFTDSLNDTVPVGQDGINFYPRICRHGFTYFIGRSASWSTASGWVKGSGSGP